MCKQKQHLFRFVLSDKRVFIFSSRVCVCVWRVLFVLVLTDFGVQSMVYSYDQQHHITSRLHAPLTFYINLWSTLARSSLFYMDKQHSTLSKPENAREHVSSAHAQFHPFIMLATSCVFSAYAPTNALCLHARTSVKCVCVCVFV